LILSACAPSYVQPLSLTSANGGKIVESEIHDWTPRLPSVVVNIIAVDNRITGRFGNAAAIVTPGPHQITFGAFYPDGVGPFGDLGDFNLVANFQSGETYYVRSSEPQRGWGNVVSAQVWIVDADGNVVSPSTTMLISGPQVILP